MTALFTFESGNMNYISFSILLRLQRTIGLVENWEGDASDLPEFSYYIKNIRKFMGASGRFGFHHC